VQYLVLDSFVSVSMMRSGDVSVVSYHWSVVSYHWSVLHGVVSVGVVLHWSVLHNLDWVPDGLHLMDGSHDLLHWVWDIVWDLLDVELRLVAGDLWGDVCDGAGWSDDLLLGDEFVESWSETVWDGCWDGEVGEVSVGEVVLWEDGCCTGGVSVVSGVTESVSVVGCGGVPVVAGVWEGTVGEWEVSVWSS